LPNADTLHCLLQACNKYVSHNHFTTFFVQHFCCAMIFAQTIFYLTCANAPKANTQAHLGRFLQQVINIINSMYYSRDNGAECRSGHKPGARVLIPSGYLHPGKGTHLRSLKFIKYRGRMVYGWSSHWSQNMAVCQEWRWEKYKKYM
jgi:hypothetical protein